MSELPPRRGYPQYTGLTLPLKFLAIAQISHSKVMVQLLRERMQSGAFDLEDFLSDWSHSYDRIETTAEWKRWGKETPLRAVAKWTINKEMGLHLGRRKRAIFLEKLIGRASWAIGDNLETTQRNGENS